MSGIMDDAKEASGTDNVNKKPAKSDPSWWNKVENDAKFIMNKTVNDSEYIGKVTAQCRKNFEEHPVDTGRAISGIAFGTLGIGYKY